MKNQKQFRKAKAHLELIEREATAEPNARVVLLRLATDERAKVARDGAGVDGLGLLLAETAPALLLGRLVEPRLHLGAEHLLVPVLVVVRVHQHVVVLHHGCFYEHVRPNEHARSKISQRSSAVAIQGGSGEA